MGIQQGKAARGLTGSFDCANYSQAINASFKTTETAVKVKHSSPVQKILPKRSAFIQNDLLCEFLPKSYGKSENKITNNIIYFIKSKYC